MFGFIADIVFKKGAQLIMGDTGSSKTSGTSDVVSQVVGRGLKELAGGAFGDDPTKQARPRFQRKGPRGFTSVPYMGARESTTPAQAGPSTARLKSAFMSRKNAVLKTTEGTIGRTISKTELG